MLEKILQDFSRITNWDEWDDFEQKYFNFPEKEINAIDEIIDIEISLDGEISKNVYVNYDVSGELMDLYEMLRWENFKKLEPETHEENQQIPEFYGKICHHCNIYAEKYKKDFCPIYSKKLRIFPLNNW